MKVNFISLQTLYAHVQLSKSIKIINVVYYFIVFINNYLFVNLEPPKFENLPLLDNCTSYCFSSQPHLFRCELNADYYIAREVKVEKFWLVDGLRLDSLPYHGFYFKNDDVCEDLIFAFIH